MMIAEKVGSGLLASASKRHTPKYFYVVLGFSYFDRHS